MVDEYVACPECPTWSLAVLPSGRLRRHVRGAESVDYEFYRKWAKKTGRTLREAIASDLCVGSGRLVRPRGQEGSR